VDAKKAKPLSEADRVRLAHYLQPNKHVIIDGDIRKLALQIVGNEQNPVLAARKLYDWLLENVEYWVKDPKNKKASPVGSTTYCLTFRTGNCTDFESLWTSFSRSIESDADCLRFLSQTGLDGARPGSKLPLLGGVLRPGLGWIPHDVPWLISTPENSRSTTTTRNWFASPLPMGPMGQPEKVSYFGNLDERRVWVAQSRLILNPRQDGEPVNACPKAYVEIDGKEHPETKGWVRKLTFRKID
jgi:hypothetical protein